MTVVLAGSFAETAKFAQQQGLRNIRHIANRDVLRAMSPFVASEVHVLPSFYDRRDVHSIEEELNRTDRQFVGFERLEYVAVKGGYYPADSDEVASAIPAPPAQTEMEGQISVEDVLAELPAEPVVETPAAEVIADVQASQLAALKASEPLDKDEFLAQLEAKGIIEPEGFELSDDPAEQAKQILTSAAHFADLPDGEPEADATEDDEFLKMIGGGE